MTDLGIFANDPRIHVDNERQVRVRGGSQVRHHSGERWFLIHHSGRVDFAGTLEQCLAYALGEPATVGPTGLRDWMHTDGDVYRHDPATTGMRPAGVLQPGDVVDWPHVAAFTVAGPAVSRQDEIGQWSMAFPVELADGTSTFWFYGDDSMVPVRFRSWQ